MNFILWIYLCSLVWVVVEMAKDWQSVGEIMVDTMSTNAIVGFLAICICLLGLIALSPIILLVSIIYDVI